MAQQRRKRQPKDDVSNNEFEKVEVTETIEEATEKVEEPKPAKKQSKIVKADLPKASVQKLTRGTNTYRVFVNGNERELTPSAIKAISKDKSLDLEIPESTDFELPNVRKCKDC